MHDVKNEQSQIHADSSIEYPMMNDNTIVYRYFYYAEEYD